MLGDFVSAQKGTARGNSCCVHLPVTSSSAPLPRTSSRSKPPCAADAGITRSEIPSLHSNIPVVADFGFAFGFDCAETQRETKSIVTTASTILLQTRKIRFVDFLSYLLPV